MDRDGNEYPGQVQRTEIPVVQWYVGKVEESQEDSVLRTVDELTVYVPADTPVDPAAVFELPDGSRWPVHGHPRDYNHGFHGWAPGVLVYTARNTEG